MNKRIFSGVQPSGNLHIGNYLGAIKNWVKLQDEYESIFCVVDLHAITVTQDPEELRKKTIEIAKIYLAAGIDPNKSTIFVQSQIAEHSELCWVLNTIAKISEMERMTQFKDKSGITDTKKLQESLFTKLRNFDFKLMPEIQKHIMENENIDYKKYFPLLIERYSQLSGYIANFLKIKSENDKQEGSSMGLFDYPVLMAADILLYDTNIVPVGEDQVQHVELARVLARRFNQKFGETFVVPEAKLVKEGARIMGLDDPSKKMSKSAASEYNYISLTDDADTIHKKIKKAVTDSGSEIVYSENKPALHNLINIYSLFSEKSPKEIEKMYQGKGYADFKADLAQIIIEGLKPIQKKIASLTDAEVLAILHESAKKLSSLAKDKMAEIKNKVGFVS